MTPAFAHFSAAYLHAKSELLAGNAAFLSLSDAQFATLTESQFVRACLRAILHYDLCPLGFAARWPVLELHLGDGSAKAVQEGLADPAVMSMSIQRRSKHQWMGAVVREIVIQGWEGFRERVRQRSAVGIHALPNLGVVGAYVALRGTLLPDDASERPLFTVMARTGAYKEVTTLGEVYQKIQEATGDSPAVVDRVLFAASKKPHWEVGFTALGNEPPPRIHYASKGRLAPKRQPLSKGSTHARNPRPSCISGVRVYAPRQRFRSGY